MAFVIAVVVESEGCCSHCDHGGDVAVVITVCIKVLVFVVIVVGYMTLACIAHETKPRYRLSRF